MTLPAPVPDIDPVTAEFWAATTEGRLLLRYCIACERTMWYPRSKCPFCHSVQLDWRQASGNGTVYSFSVTDRGQEEFAGIGPYVLAYVELQEGPIMLTNVVDCPPDSVTIGQPVEVTFAETGHGAAIPRFRPAEAARRDV